jgi:hypothetical protein
MLFLKNHTYKTMGLFWNLIQQSQISDQKGRAETLETRVDFLEYELQRTKSLLIDALKILEEQSGKDIDGDGKLG